MKDRKKIRAEHLVAMDSFADTLNFRIDLAYARPDNLLFGEAIYRPDAQLWLHEDLARIVQKAAKICTEKHTLRLVLYDGLRTVEAQAKMLETRRVKDNPHWLKEPALLSSPGTGGHPRGMAIDVALETPNGTLVDMGTPFDHMAENSSPEHNPAHRQYFHSDEISANREKLKNAMLQAAAELNLPLLPLPEEWWDFRFPRDIIEQYEPLSDADLPPDMRYIDDKTTPRTDCPSIHLD